MTYFMQDNYSVYDTLPCSTAVFMINDDLDIVYKNAVYNDMFGNKCINIYDSDRAAFDEVLSGADTPKCVYFKSRNSRGKTINVRAFVIKISEERAFGLFIDDSKNIEIIQALDTKCARYAAAISGTDETFYEYNMNTDVFTIFYSSDEGNIVVREVKDFCANISENVFFPEEEKAYIKNLIQKKITKEKRFEIHMRVRPEDDFEWYRIFVKPDKREGIYVGSGRNINDTKVEEEKLKEKALIDPLSKVYNRAAAIEKIEKKLKKRSKDSECALIVLDIDNFKRINDTFGHLYGDAVIAMAAGSIKNTLDKADIVGRFGGDEFFVFIDNAKKEALEKKLNDIRESILKMRRDQKDEKDISCSIGVALGAGGSLYSELFRQADSALYAAKKNGKNRFEYFNGEYFDEGSLSYAGNDEDESNEAHNVTAVALEIASKSSNAENAISNIMRHIGMAAELNCIQIMKYDTIEDKVYIEFQWWRENNGEYNVVATDKKMGYYNHNDLIIFKNRFAKDKIFPYTPEFKEGFSPKYRDVLEKVEHIKQLYSSSTESDSVFYAMNFQAFDNTREWTEDEIKDMYEITKIISMYLKSSYVTTDREKMLIKRLDYDWTGFYSIAHFYEEAGKLTRAANERGDYIGLLHIDVKDMYGINITYGRGVGDHVIDEIIELLEKADPKTANICHVDGTDNFVMMFITPRQDGVAEAIEKELIAISDKFSEYKEPPVIIKGGLTFFRPGVFIVDYLDVAKNIKKKVVFDRSRCVVAEGDVPTQYKTKNQYQSPDRRKIE